MPSNSLSFLFPIVIDGFIAYGVRALLVLRDAPLGARLYVWALFGVATASSPQHPTTALVTPTRTIPATVTRPHGVVAGRRYRSRGSPKSSPRHTPIPATSPAPWSATPSRPKDCRQAMIESPRQSSNFSAMKQPGRIPTPTEPASHPECSENQPAHSPSTPSPPQGVPSRNNKAVPSRDNKAVHSGNACHVHSGNTPVIVSRTSRHRRCPVRDESARHHHPTRTPNGEDPHA